MRLLRALTGLLFVLALTAGANAQESAAIPPLTAHVTDTIGMLDAKQRESLDNVLKEYEARTGSQVAILLIASTEPETIEQYGIRVAEAWKLGRKNVDDGVILIVARDNPKALRRLRIEVGRGVQGTLTDAQSRRILADVIAPHFRQKDYYGGLTAAATAITTLLDQEHLPAADNGAQAGEDDFMDSALPIIIFLVVFIFIVMKARAQRNGLSSNRWGRDSGVILGGGSWGSSGGGSSGGGFSGGGGGFDGGGSSGDW